MPTTGNSLESPIKISQLLFSFNSNELLYPWLLIWVGNNKTNTGTGIKKDWGLHELSLPRQISTSLAQKWWFLHSIKKNTTGIKYNVSKPLSETECLGVLPWETSFETGCRFSEVVEHKFSTLGIHLNFSSLIYQIISKDTEKESKVFSLYKK